MEGVVVTKKSIYVAGYRRMEGCISLEKKGEMPILATNLSEIYDVARRNLRPLIPEFTTR